MDLGLGAEHRLLQIQIELVAQICAAKHLRSAALAAGKDVAEHFAENVAECLAGTEAAGAIALEAGMTELIVDGALMGIAQDFVGFLALLEAVLGFRVVGIAIRMEFHGEPAIRLLDLGFGGGSGHLEEFIEILLRHCSPRAETPIKANRRHLVPAVRLDTSIPSNRLRRLRPSFGRFP